DKVSAAVEKSLSDPERIQKFIKRLDAPTPEERAFAFDQLYRSKERAVPYLVEALRTTFGKRLHERLVRAMLRLDSATLPPLFEVLKANDEKDAKDIELRMTLLDIIHQRDERRVIPYLWHLSSAKQYPDTVKKKAKAILSNYLKRDELNLPPAKVALTELAEEYYNHRFKFPPDKVVRLWPWDGNKLSVTPVE